MNKIHGGTVNHSATSLCYVCRNATVVRGQTMNEEIVSCNQLHPDDRIRFKVTSCSEFSDKTTPSKRDFQAIAWHINTDTKTGKIGFVSPAQRRRDSSRFEDLD